MKVKAKYTFRVDLGFGNVYEFFEGKITEIKDSDAGYLFEKYPGMLDVVSKETPEEKNEEVSDVSNQENSDNEDKPKGQKNKTKK
jgi:hypothetical protein